MSDQTNIKDIIKQEYVKCASDPIHFFRKYCYITHPIRGRVLFHLYPFQEAVLQSFRINDYNIINKSRQLGISTLCAGYALWLMLFHKDKAILCIATKQLTAQNMVEKVQFMYNQLPSWLKGSKPISSNQTSLKLANGSFIKATSASSDAGRSFAVSWLIMDEAAFIEGIDKIYTAIKPTISSGGGCVALSSPNGVGNWFHKTWIDADLGKNSFIPIELKWNVHPERDEAWMDRERENMTSRDIAQEYECDFLGSGATVIDPDTLLFYEQTFLQDPIEKRFLGGDFWIWQYPDYNKNYIIAADVARGDGNDHSAFQVIDIESCEQVAEFKSQIGTRDYGNMLVSVATEYNNALLVVENASVGWDVVNTIIEREYANLYYSPRAYGEMSADKYLSKLDSGQTVPGFTTSAKTRPLVISKMESYLRDRSFTFHSKRLLEELRVFIWLHGKAQAQNGYNDDLTMSLAIGLFIRDTASRFSQMGADLASASLMNIKKTGGEMFGGGRWIKNGDPYSVDDSMGNVEDVRWLFN
jgi:hypothetical protein